MANLALTATCNRACAYCFAADVMATHDTHTRHMPVDRVEAALDFLVRSNITEARLLGGEPTVHPAFAHVVDAALARGLRLIVFTGGLVPHKALAKLEALSDAAVTIVLNVVAPDGGAVGLFKRQKEIFRLGAKVMLGVTIDSPAVRLAFLVDLIEQHGLSRRVRLGLAHPTLNATATYLHARHYGEVGRRVLDFGLFARSRGVHLTFDCGWVPCMFPEGALSALGVPAGEVGLRCNPVLDLLPDGRIISCFALASHGSMCDVLDGDAGDLRAIFSKRQEADRRFTRSRECDGCDWRRRGECTGGCLSASLLRLRHREFSVVLPAVVPPNHNAPGYISDDR